MKKISSFICGIAVGLILAVGLVAADTVTTSTTPSTPASTMDEIIIPVGSSTLPKIATAVTSLDPSAQAHLNAGLSITSVTFFKNSDNSVTFRAIFQ